MNRGLKYTLIIVLGLIAFLFGWRFKINYDQMMDDRAERVDRQIEQADRLAGENEGVAAPQYHLGFWGAGMIMGLLVSGILLAHEVSVFFGNRAVKALYDDDGEGPASPDYDAAEEVWANGDFLEAIRLLREYLQKNPREQHVALRIAEIYEKDMHNPLAAALEYEEVLTKKLPAERWGWAAIHLCNLYTGKLHKPEQAIGLLQRIDREYGDTAAAKKARARLEQLQDEGIIPKPEPEPDETPPPDDVPPPPPGPSLPPGFAPRKS